MNQTRRATGRTTRRATKRATARAAKPQASDAPGAQLALRLVADAGRSRRGRDENRARIGDTRNPGERASTATTAVPLAVGAGESLVAILAIVLVGVISAALHAGAV